MRESLTIECADRHITRNRPANSSVIFVMARRLLNDIHIAGLACYTDRHSSVMAAKDSPTYQAGTALSNDRLKIA